MKPLEKPVTLELFYTLTCPNCRVMKRLLEEVLPAYGSRFKLKQTLANMPAGMIRTMRMHIHSVPTLTINNEIAFRSVPSKEEIIEKLNQYLSQ